MRDAAAIAARGLGRRFGERTAVEGLTFEVEPGEIFGLLGPNGAGKTTTLRMLCGLLAPSAGDAEVLGLALSRQAREVRRVVGLLTEQPGLYDRLTARENLAYFARLYGVGDTQIAERLPRLFATLGLAGREDDRVGGFSKGMRQKVAIARALVHEPNVVFLDEPTSGLDPEASAQVRGIVEALSAQGRTIVLCTHNLDEAARLCRRVAVVKGRILALGPPRELARSAPSVAIEVEGDAAPLLQALAASGRIVSVQGTVLDVTLAQEADVSDVVSQLVGLGARIRKVQPHRELEEAYLRLVSAGR